MIGDPELDKYKEDIVKIVKEMDDNFDIHDFRMVKGPTHVNLIFDVAISYETKLSENDVSERLKAK